jgi:translation initiation factor IF-1
MVKNTTGGNRHKKQKNNVLKEKRPLVLKDEKEGEHYGQIINILGGSWVTVRKLGTEKEFRCRVRHAKGIGKMSKLDIVLFALRDFETKLVSEKKPNGDIIVIYNSDEVNILKKDKHIPNDVVVDDLFINEEDDDDDETNIEERNANKIAQELAIKEKRADKEELNNEEINIDNI